MCHLYSIQICSKKCPTYTNEVFRLAENIRINTRNSFIKLNHLFQKNSAGQKGLSYIGPAIWNWIPDIFKKTRNLNTFKHKMLHYHLNDLSNPNLWNLGWFDYALANIIQNIFLFIKQIFLHPFVFFFLLHFLSNIAINISILYLWLIFLFF